jgi:hypothetical protein
MSIDGKRVHQMYRGDLRELFRNPVAFLGGITGAVLASAGLYLAFTVFSEAHAQGGDEEEELDIEFEPGALVRLGQKIEEKELPEKIIVQETRAEEETSEATVTEDEKAKPTEDKPDPEKEPKKTDKPPPHEKKDSKLPTSKNPTTSNTPYKDLPNVNYNIGDPFGDPGGWSDLAKDGDPWATSVMKALNNMKVGAYAAKGSGGDYRFQLTICKDGSIKSVTGKGGSLPQEAQNAVRLSLEQLDIPKPPSDVSSKMKGDCAKIRYTFAWSASGVK